MCRGFTFRFLFCALVSLALTISGAAAAPVPAPPAQFGVGVYVGFGPPAIPIYDQPICPGDGYLWAPGYWAWDGDEYYWVPGTWILAPEVGFFWTPGYWEWAGGRGFFFHEGYWGPQVGFYGGINYGFGYYGHGYEGGRWDGGHFFYNRTVNNVNVTLIHNVYNTTIINNNTNRVSYNGGNGGVSTRPTAEEQRFDSERHVPPVAAQTQHVEAARNNRELRATVNQGRPPIAATERAGAFNERTVAAKEAGGRYERPPTNVAPSTPRPAVHPNDLPPIERPSAPNTGNPRLDQRYQQQQQNLYNKQNQERQNLQQRQQRQDQNLVQRNAPPVQRDQMEQRHQGQTQQMQQRHVQQQQQMQQRQAPRQGGGRGR